MLYILLLVILSAAYFDYKYKRIPDFITAIGWLVLVFTWFFYADSAPLLIAGASFAILFPLNSVISLRAAPLLAWGDILLLPVYVAYCSSTPLFTTLLLTPLAAMFLYVLISGKNKQVALAPFLAFAAVISVLAA